MRIRKRISSPITTSFHRKKVDTGVIVFDTGTHAHEWVKLDLPQLLRKTIKAGDPMPEDPPHHTIYEVEGDMNELANMAEHGLLDKKIVKRSTDAALILEPEMTIEQEISEYLEFILELPEETIEKALKLYHDSTTHLKLE
jgi:GR25 family glycosyltransferase involved in LPS biosynthesis